LFSDKTYILTNNHVVEHAEKIRVKFHDGREFDAKITGRDPKSDVAVIEVKEEGFAEIIFADSSLLEVGEWVAAPVHPALAALVRPCTSSPASRISRSSTRFHP